ncbi:MAG TPA: SGNH/GDSL hydrolase family protein [Pseudonocardiaceae bacterium]
MTGRLRRRLRPITVLVTALSTAFTALLAGTSAAAEPAQVNRYVALGDSFTAGPLIPDQHLNPLGCLRSTRNYPSLLAERLGVSEFVDVSCSGATTEDMTQAQSLFTGETAPPQFSALTPDTDLVTVGIGGNDIGFVDILVNCAKLSITNPLGAPCKAEATEGGVDRYRERIAQAAPKVGAVLRGIRERAPHAQVVLVGYLRILPSRLGCWPVVPIAVGDVPYLDGVQQELNAMMAEQAAAHGALFVDAYAHSTGRDVCKASDVRWVEGILPSQPAAPVHPNAAGMRATADLVSAQLGVTSAGRS